MTGDEVRVHVNRDGPGTIDFEPRADEFEPRGSFALAVTNHGDPAHVHCRLEGDLVRIAEIEGSNFYVEPGDEVRVPVAVDRDVDQPVDGRVEASTRFGTESAALEVAVGPGRPSVEVDESLAEPPGASDSTAAEGRSGGDAGTETPVGDVDPATLGVVALAVVALALAGLSASVVGGVAAVVALSLVVSGLVVAGVLLRR